MKATISILTATAIRESSWCLQNLVSGTHRSDYNLILTGNGHDASFFFQSFRDQHPEIETMVLKNTHNEGFIDPNRRALAMTQDSETEIFIMLNDDALVSPGWLDVIFNVFKADPKLGACGPQGFGLGPGMVGGVRVAIPEYIQGSCLAVRTELAKRYNICDSELHWAYGEDSDLCLSLRQDGFKIGVVDFPFVHMGGTTTKKVKSSATIDIFTKNHEYLARKWARYLKTRSFA